MSNREEGNSWIDDQGDLHISFTGPKKTGKTIASKAQLDDYQDGIDLASGYPNRMIWTTADGRRIAVPNLSDSHLLSILQHIRSNIDRYKKQVAAKFITNSLAIIWRDQAEDILIEERARQIVSMDDEEFLSEFAPIYSELYKEAYKRKIYLEVE